MGSTTIRWEPVRIGPALDAHVTVRAQRAPLPQSAWNPRQPITLTVRWRGGSEAYVSVEARGVKWIVPGHLSVLEMMLEIWH